MTATWRTLLPGSSATRLSMTSSGDKPFSNNVNHTGPKAVFAQDCVATAPTLAFAHGTTEPTAKNFDWTATPTSPVSGSAATIENVATNCSLFIMLFTPFLYCRIIKKKFPLLTILSTKKSAAILKGLLQILYFSLIAD